MACKMRFAETRLPTSAKFLGSTVTLSELGEVKEDAANHLYLISALQSPLPAGHYNDYFLFYTGPDAANEDLCVRWVVYGMNDLIHYQSPAYYLKPISNKYFLTLDPSFFWATNYLTIRLPNVGHEVRIEVTVTPLDSHSETEMQSNFPSATPGKVKQISLTQQLLQPIPIDSKIIGSEDFSQSSLSYILNAYRACIDAEATSRFPADSSADKEKCELLKLLLSSVTYASLTCWEKNADNLSLLDSIPQGPADRMVYDPWLYEEYPEETAIMDTWMNLEGMVTKKKPTWTSEQNLTSKLLEAKCGAKLCGFKWNSREAVFSSFFGGKKTTEASHRRGEYSFFYRGFGLCSLSASAIAALRDMTENAPLPAIADDESAIPDIAELAEAQRLDFIVDYVNLTRFPAFVIKVTSFILSRLVTEYNLTEATLSSKGTEVLKKFYSRSSGQKMTSQMKLACSALVNLRSLFRAFYVPLNFSLFQQVPPDFTGSAAIPNPRSGFSISFLQCALKQIGFLADPVTGELDGPTEQAIKDFAAAAGFVRIRAESPPGTDDHKNGDLHFNPCDPLTGFAGKSFAEFPLPASLFQRLKEWLKEGRYCADYDIVCGAGSVTDYLKAQQAISNPNDDVMKAIKTKLMALGYWSMDFKDRTCEFAANAPQTPIVSGTARFQDMLNGALYLFQREHGLHKNGKITQESIYLMYYLARQERGEYYQRPGYYCKVPPPVGDKFFFSEANGKNGKRFENNLKNALTQKYYEIPVRMKDGKLTNGFPINSDFSIASEIDLPSDFYKPGGSTELKYLCQLFACQRMLRSLLSATQKWQERVDGTSSLKLLLYNDISADHGNMPTPGMHDTHKYGIGIDLAGQYTDAKNQGFFDRTNAVELGKILYDSGFSCVFSSCKYVCDHVNEYVCTQSSWSKSIGNRRIFAATADQNHHHHFHADVHLKASRNDAGIEYMVTLQPAAAEFGTSPTGPIIPAGWYKISYTMKRENYPKPGESTSYIYTNEWAVSQPTENTKVQKDFNKKKLICESPQGNDVYKPHLHYEFRENGAELILKSPVEMELNAISCLTKLPFNEDAPTKSIKWVNKNPAFPKRTLDGYVCLVKKKALIPTSITIEFTSPKRESIPVNLAVNAADTEVEMAASFASQLEDPGKSNAIIRDAFEAITDGKRFYIAYRPGASGWSVRISGAQSLISMNPFAGKKSHRFPKILCRTRYCLLPSSLFPKIGKDIIEGAPVVLSALRFKKTAESNPVTIPVGVAGTGKTIIFRSLSRKGMPSFADAIADSLSIPVSQNEEADFYVTWVKGKKREYIAIEPKREAQSSFVPEALELIFTNPEKRQITADSCPLSVLNKYRSPLWCDFTDSTTGKSCPYKSLNIANRPAWLKPNDIVATWNALPNKDPVRDDTLYKKELAIWNYSYGLSDKDPHKSVCFYHLPIFVRKIPEFTLEIK